jgi:hypothetical protein
MATSSAERREYPRAAIDYRGVLETAHGDKINLRARNISGSGIYFDTEKRLTEFIEVSLTVVLPPVGGEPELTFRCDGIIVRVIDNAGEGDWPFGAAVHFTDIRDYHRQAVCGYVAAVMVEKTKQWEERNGRLPEC